MKLIIPMAGKGTRLRPVTLTTPKPLVKIAGKTIVTRLIEELYQLITEPITDIAFIIGNFGEEIKNDLTQIANKFKAKAHFYIQESPLGTAHAVFLAKKLLNQKVIIAFADTLFISNKKLNLKNLSANIIFTKRVEDPSHYGVVVTDKNGFVTKFIEKPKQLISNQAIVGIYYFYEAQKLRDKLDFLISNKIITNGEYQLTDALQLMLNQNEKFKTFEIEEWLDCGNKNFLLKTNAKILDYKAKNEILHNSTTKNTIIIPPVYIGKNVKIENSIIGPYVSIEDNATISHSIISNSIVFNTAKVKSVNLKDSLIGQKAIICGKEAQLSISDFTEVKV